MKAYSNVLSHDKVIDLTRQIFTSVDFLHMNRIIHVSSIKLTFLINTVLFFFMILEGFKATEYFGY